jgi:hypothetical protein
MIDAERFMVHLVVGGGLAKKILLAIADGGKGFVLVYQPVEETDLGALRNFACA